MTISITTRMPIPIVPHTTIPTIHQTMSMMMIPIVIMIIIMTTLMSTLMMITIIIIHREFVVSTEVIAVLTSLILVMSTFPITILSGLPE